MTYTVQKSIDELWLEVKKYYESAYGIRFTTRLSDKKIKYLYDEMQRLEASLEKHRHQARVILYDFVKRSSSSCPKT